MRKDPTEFRKRFAKWKEGGKPYKDGKISDEQYVSIMENVAADNWLQWGDESEDAALTRILNDNAYDYRGYYNDNPKSAANADTHWPDEYKTVWHPTFSNQSKYSGKKSQYNPYGYPGGTWQGELFNPQWYQQHLGTGFYKDGYPKLPKFEGGEEEFKPKKTPEFVQAGKDNSWSKVTNDDMGEVFQSVVARPNRTGGMVERWRNGEKVFDAGRRVEKSDNTSVQKQEPKLAIKRDFLAEATRKHAAEAVGPDYRSVYQQKQSQAEKQYANEQYQKAKDDAKRAEGLGQMMKTISPSTYVEAATGLDLGTAGRLITDAAAFGLPGAIKSIAGPTMQYGRNFLLSQTMKRSLNKNPMLRTYNSSPQYLDTGGNVLKYLDYIESLFPNSKVKDIVYHSTWAKPFELFDPSKIKRGYGFYFSPSENHLPFDRMVYSKVDIRNPLEIFPNKNRDLDVSGLWRKELTEKAIKEGLHDGVIGVSNMRNPGEPEIVALNPDQVHILGSQLDRNQFAGFMRKLNRKSTIKDGYIYKNRTVTPGEYKYYGQKVNYSDPSKNELSDYQLDDMMGDYIGRGAERTVYQDLRNNNRVLKITDGGSPDVQITNQNDLLDYVDESLRINNLPEVPRLSYEGFIKDGNRYLPVFSLQKVTPLKKVADPFLVFTRQYVLPNGKTPSGKLSTIRKMNRDAFSRIGYEPIQTKPGVYSVNGIGGSYNITDLGLKNVGIDALGNLKIFDPMFE